MNNFRGGDSKGRGGSFSGKPRFGDKRGGSFGGGERRKSSGFGGGDRGGRGGSGELFKATCSTCRRPCEVPFRPNGDKPVYCSACFNMKSRDEERGSAPREYGNRDNARSTRPEYAKPRREYAPQRDEAPRVVKDTGLEDVKRQLATIESRLNRILDLLNPPTPPVKKKAVVIAEVPAVPETLTEELPKKTRKPKTVKEKVPAKKTAAKKVTAKKTK